MDRCRIYSYSELQLRVMWIRNSDLTTLSALITQRPTLSQFIIQSMYTTRLPATLRLES